MDLLPFSPLDEALKNVRHHTMNLAAPLLISLALLTLTGAAQDQTVAVPELEKLQQEYAALVKTADGQYLAAVGEVDKKYIARLEQEQKTAQQAGKLDDAMALDAEKKAISSGSGVPVGDDDKTPGVLKPMHATYRAAIAKLEPLRVKNLKPLRDDYAKELDALVLRLTKDGKLQEAVTVRKFREEFHVVLGGGALSAKRLTAEINVRIKDYRDVSRSDKTPTIDIKTTSQYPGLERHFISDGDKMTGFAFLGPTGTIDFAFSQDVTAKQIIIIGRIKFAFDEVTKGTLIINKIAKFDIGGFSNQKMIVIENPKRLPIRTLSIESIKGINNPGINEMYFLGHP